MAQSTDKMPDQSTSFPMLPGQVLKAERLRQNRTQEDVAEAAGIEQSTLSKVERSSRDDMKTPAFQKVAKALGVDVRTINE